MERKSVLILSGASYDSIIYLDEFPEPVPQTIHQSIFTEGPGSTGVGKASNLCHLGFDAHLQYLVGNDVYGDQISNFLNRRPLMLHKDIDPGGTERHVNIMNKKGQRISIFVNSATAAPPINYAKYDALIQQSDFVVLNIIDYARNFIPLIKKHEKEVWTDLHDYNEGNPYHEDFIHASDYIFLSSDNLSDYKATMQKFMQMDKKLVVCTHGKEGASALTSSRQWIETPAINSFMVNDTNGAGDAFFSGYLYAHNQGYGIEQCLTYGHVLGGLCVESPDIAPRNLSIDLVEKVFKKIT